jgi:hypothetical protein
MDLLGFAQDKCATLSSSVQGEFGGEPTMDLLFKIQPPGLNLVANPVAPNFS